MLLAIPSTTVSDKLGPVGAPAGTSALICQSPAKPGARPLNWTGSCKPCRNTLGITGLTEYGCDPAAAPSATAGDTEPCPLAKICSTSPGCAGVAGEFTVPS